MRNVVTSTQDLAAAELADTGQVTLVVAHEQTCGRGRTGNPWWQADRAVAASLSVPIELLEVEQTLPLAVGLAVRDAIDTTLGCDVGLKWPNDIVRAGAKVGGILVEMHDDMVVVGCGINLFWADPPAGAGSLCVDDPGTGLGVELSRHWAETVLSEGFGWDRRSYVAACETLGSFIEWEPDGAGIAAGVAVGIAADGGLVVDTGRGLTTLHAGEVRAIRRVSDDA